MPALTILFLSASITLAVAHYFALEFYLYWTYLWLDIPMHLLGGICVALALSVVSLFPINFPKQLTSLKGYLIVVFVVGILWEVFEYFNGLSVIREEDFLLYTLSDLTLDLLGGSLGYFIAKKVNTLYHGIH